MSTQSRPVQLLAVLLFLAAFSAVPSVAGTAPDGFEFIISNTTAQDQSRPIVASRGGDGFVIVWSSFGQVAGNDETMARLFDRHMFPLGSEFQVNVSTAGDQSEGRVAGNAIGEFVIVWTSWFQGDGDGEGVLARRYDSAGMSVGGELVVNTYTTGSQLRPAVAMDPSGAFVVVWASAGQDGNDYGIFGRRFDSAGSALGGEFQVNAYTTGGQTFPAVSMDDTGEFAVVWTSFGAQDGSDAGVFGRRFDSAGSPQGGDFLVNASTLGIQRAGEVAHLPSGGFVVVWSDSLSLDGSGYSVQGRLFDSGGSAVGGEFQANTSTLNDQRFPSVAAESARGTFVVSWTHTVYPGSDYEIRGQRFLQDGTPLGLEFQLNAYTPGAQRIPDIATDPDGDFVVSWIDNGADGDGLGVIARRFYGGGPEILDPRPGDSVDCSDPVNVQPTFTWEPGDYDRFKVFMSSSNNFLKGTYVTSGKRWIRDPFWSVRKKKWKRICLKALAVNPSSPVMYIKLEGKDRDLSRKDPAKRIDSFVVPVEPAP